MTNEENLPAWRRWQDDELPLQLGVSACLLGEELRYDGGHKRHRYLVEILGPELSWIPICPEVELGMGIPRPPIRLEETEGSSRLVEMEGLIDHSAAMTRFSRNKLRQLKNVGLDGCILKSKSPSCGLGSVEVWLSGRPIHREGSGFFAKELREGLPLLPLIEESGLEDVGQKEQFIERIFCHNRWRVLTHAPPSLRRLGEFHRAHALLLRARDENLERALKDLATLSDPASLDAVYHEYFRLFSVALSRPTTRSQHLKLMRALSTSLGNATGAEKAIEDFGRGRIGASNALAILRRASQDRGEKDAAQHLYLCPHPAEERLRHEAPPALF